MYSYAVLPVNCNGRPGSQRGDDMRMRDCELQERGDGLAVEPMSRNPEGRGSIPRLGSRRSSFISIELAELLSSSYSLMLCCARLVTMALHVHCGLGQLRPLPTSGDDK